MHFLHWKLFLFDSNLPVFQLTIIHDWFIYWLGTKQVTINYLNWCWFGLLLHICITRIYASLMRYTRYHNWGDDILSLVFRKLIFLGCSCMPPINFVREQIDEAQLFNEDTSIISEVTHTNQTKLVKEIQSGPTHQTWHQTYYQHPLLH